MQQNHKAVIVGSGGQARLVARLLSASGRCTVSCFVEASEAARDALRERRPECPVATDLAEALQEHRPDVAVVCGPVGQRAEQILACLRAGCRVLAPGPLCSNSAEAGEIVEMFRCDKSLKLVACLPDRFISPRPEAVRLAHRGQLGRLFLVENAGAIPRPAETKDDAQSQEQAEADLLFASASVPLDLIIHAARRRVEEVHAVSTGSGADATHLLCMSLEGGLAARH